MPQLPLGLTRERLAAAGAVLAAIVVVVVVLILRATLWAPVHASLEASDLNQVRIREPVKIHFNQTMDMRGVKVSTEPAARLRLTGSGRVLSVAPVAGWKPAQQYTLSLASISNKTHTATLQGWQARFTTQPDVAVSALQVDGRPVGQNPAMTIASRLSVVFTVPMKPSSVKISLGTTSLAQASLSWSAGNTTVSFGDQHLTPEQPVALAIAKGAVSRRGFPLAKPTSWTFQVSGLEPANSTTGVTSGFTTKTPIEIVVENSGPARPQRGLQNADMVYEYISEYSISRMTAIYFNKIPALVGPVRSCRPINTYLDYAYDGLFMCSGASVGTLHYMFGGGGLPLIPGTINDFDQGNHFFRSSLNFAPHNLFTDSGRTERLRSEWKAVHPPTFQVDPPHPDLVQGQPAAAPSVPLQSVSYQYDAASRQYLRFDHGAPFIDALTGHQLQVKNVVLLHVPFHYTDWIEDFNGGAHGVWYDMLGSGPAEIYSDGRLIQATWHMGAAPSQRYYDNHSPVYFTDAQGNVIRLNTGLTWIHVLGNGQTH